MRILTWPFRILFSLIGFVLALAGRVVCFALGLALIIAGICATATVVGAIVGIPLILFGIGFFVRTIF